MPVPRSFRRFRPRWWWLVLALGMATAQLIAESPTYGKTTVSGPPLDTDVVALETAVSCPDGLSHPEHSVVLLVHGIAVTSTESWPDSLGSILPEAGFDWCMVQLPNRAFGDIQTSAEYVVAGVRAIHRRSGRQVSLVGHSLGADEIRWAVRWWPDVRAAVDDLVTIEGVNRGVPFWNAHCAAGRCSPAAWQLRMGAAFIDVLNRVPTLPGPAYTTTRSLTDIGIQPAWPESAAAGAIDGAAANVLIQDICPGRVVDHVGAIFDAAEVAVVMDALQHPGPADPGRIGRAVCGRMFAAGIDPGRATVSIATLYADALTRLAVGPMTDREPPLPPYALGG